MKFSSFYDSKKNSCCGNYMKKYGVWNSQAFMNSKKNSCRGNYMRKYGMLILDEKKHFYGSVLMKIINSRFEYLNMSRVHKTPRKKVWFIINCRYKESKEIKAGLKELKIAIANPSCDNEVLRDYFLKLIRKFVFSALDEIYSFKTEKEILARMAQMGQQSFFFLIMPNFWLTIIHWWNFSVFFPSSMSILDWKKLLVLF